MLLNCQTMITLRQLFIKDINEILATNIKILEEKLHGNITDLVNAFAAPTTINHLKTKHSSQNRYYSKYTSIQTFIRNNTKRVNLWKIRETTHRKIRGITTYANGKLGNRLQIYKEK